MLGTSRVLNTLVLSSSSLGAETMTLNPQSLAQNKVLTNCLSTYSVPSPLLGTDDMDYSDTEPASQEVLRLEEWMRELKRNHLATPGWGALAKAMVFTPHSLELQELHGSLDGTSGTVTDSGSGTEGSRTSASRAVPSTGFKYWTSVPFDEKVL